MNPLSPQSESPASAAEPYWNFFRAGGFDQVQINSAEDLFGLDRLDPKLWVALSCPVGGLEFPAETLALLDADGDGHIRAADLLAAIKWCRVRLADPAGLISGEARLPLAVIDRDSDCGLALRRSAAQILSNLGRPDDEAVVIEDLADMRAVFGQTRFNGDGIITERATDEPDLAHAIAAVGEAFGRRDDRSGEPGVDAAAIEAFFAQVRAYLAWSSARPDLPGNFDPLLAAAAFEGLRAKLDDYFARCRTIACDPRAESFMNGSDDELSAIGRASLADDPQPLRALPLARAAAGRPLSLAEGINPAWYSALVDFEAAVCRPLLGAKTHLDESGWRSIKAQLTALGDWFSARPLCPGTPEAGVLGVWQDTGVEARLLALVAQDLALEAEANGIDDVRKMLLLRRDLVAFANNFVSFRSFYRRQGWSSFQCGTLYIDGRSCELVIPVEDVAAHVQLANLSKLYLMYCHCRRGTQTRTVVAALTDGSADQIMVGRNGVFVDRDGNDWNARIVRLIEHPISLRDAFWAPYRRVGRMVSEQLQKLASSRDQANDKKAASFAAETVAPKAPVPASAAAAPSAPPPFDVAKFAGIFAALGLAVGALGTAVASLLVGLLGLQWWQMPLALFGLLLIISAPSMVLAWFKLRSRTLGPLLDANGWAINARAAINLPFGRSLTQMAKLPENASRALFDPYAAKRTPWATYLLVFVVLGAALYFWMVNGK